LSQSQNIFSQETLPEMIRQSFFLKDDAEITPAITHAFISGIETGYYRHLNRLTKEKRKDDFNIFLTHDIDWLNPAHPYSILKYLYSRINQNYRWYSYAVITQKDSLLRNIERLISLEQKHGVSSLFFLGAMNKSMGRHDIRYTTSDPLFTELIALLNASQNTTIGLHSSYHACEKELIESEKSTLEHFINKKVNIHRSHFLNYDPDQLYAQLEHSNIEYDFGLGYARTVGAKNGFSGKFRPVNIKQQRAYNITCIPLILMDNVFFFHPYQNVMNSFRDAIQKLREHNSSACILFHPENMILKPDLWHYYEEIIDICKQAGANLTQPI
jgi:hypothetical protein